MGHARALLSLSPDQQVLLGKRIAEQRMSVREAEELAQGEGKTKPAKRGTAKKNADPDITRLETDLADTLGATVKIQSGRKGNGRIVIQYGSLDQLDGILAKLR
jgi:ParB family chromosome partitioning protein